MILAGDIGGTKTALGLYTRSGAGLAAVRTEEFPSRNFASLEAVAAAFLREAEKAQLRAACFAVAGPVIAGAAQLTNLPWTVDAAALAAITARVSVINDLQAAALGSLHLEPADFCTLAGGNPGARGNIAVIAAGTGLGEAFLVWDGRRHIAVACEGGHADFAPRGDEEIALLQHLARETGGHVSYERVLSGAGLVRIYRFLRQQSGEPQPDWLTLRLAAGDPAAVISEIALAGADPVCVRALEMFVSIYGAEAGNLALKVFALGGVVVAGGIASKILGELQKGGFVSAFTAKGRFAGLMQSMPVKVVLNRHVSLIGAAYHAAEGAP